MDTQRIARETFVAGVEHHETTSSTNDLALAAGQQPDVALPLLIVAERQTAGRGRGSNRWWTAPGSLAFSLLLDGRMCPSRLGRPSLVALGTAVAIVETIEPLGVGRTGLHWPNDVFVEARKLSGILVEVLPNGRHIVGVGLNVNNSLAGAPAELQSRITSLADLAGRPLERETLLIDLLHRFERQLALLRTNPTAIGQRANDLCLQRGETLTIHCGGEVVCGQCAGIADDGGLILSVPATDSIGLPGSVSGEPADQRRVFYTGTLSHD
jgi:BirA family biotin operon repressor/biotin-[acetyl-CoA-carboxylase] ligase